MDEGKIIIWLAVTGIGIGGSLICWLLNRSISRIDKDIDDHAGTLKEHARLHSECGKDLERFKTEVHRDFAKDATMQNGFARIHARLDSLPKEIIDAVKALVQ